MEIFSSWYFVEQKIEELSRNILIREMKRAERIVIISAYYSTSFLETLLIKVNKNKRKKCSVSLIFNGFSGQRLYEQVSELEKFSGKLKNLGYKEISIFLNRGTTLFHTKLYFITNDSGSVWLAGSANASNAGFETNEEFLIKSKEKIRNIREYIDQVINDSEEIGDIDPDEALESNIVGFFRTGSIYFKPNNQLSFTFSEFKLPDTIENAIRNIEERPRNTNPGKAWGAYNLKFSLGLRDDENEKTSQVSLKPWSIETCYGYWVPNKYRFIVDNSVNEKSNSARRKFEEILSLIEVRGVDSLVDDYANYLNDAKLILRSHSIDHSFDEKELVDKYRKFVERIVSKLSDKKRLDKLCLPLVSTGMPEIWEDPIAYDDFTESFFEYIANELIGKMPRVVRSIKENLGLNADSDSDEIASSFISYFEFDEAEWSDEYWIE